MITHSKLTINLFCIFCFFLSILGAGTACATDYVLSIDSPTITEGDSGTNVLSFTVKITPEITDINSTVFVDWQTSDISAVAGADYYSASGNLVFDNTSGATQSISIDIIGDELVEHSETFYVTLMNPSIISFDNSTISISNSQGKGTITDNDSYVVSIEPGPKSTTEGNTISFDVSLDKKVAWDVDIAYTVSGSGTDPAESADFTSLGTLTIPKGTPSGTINVDLIDDNFIENDEGITVTIQGISPTDSGSISLANTASGVIQDNDIANISISDVTVAEDSGSVTFRIHSDKTAEAPASVTVDYTTSDDTASAGSDYTAINGTATISGSDHTDITVSVTDDNIVEGDEEFKLTLSNPSSSGSLSDSVAVGTIVNDDIPSLSIDDVTINEGTGGSISAAFTVTTNKAIASDSTVSVDYAVEHGTTDSSDFSGSVTGTLNLTNLSAGSGDTITIPIDTDDIVEPDETYSVKLSNPVIQNTSTAPVISDDSGSGIITNDDIPSLSIDDVSVNEGDSGVTTMSFSVTSDLQVADNADLTFDYSVSNGQAEADDFSGPLSGSVTITDGSSVNIDIGITGDETVETDEQFQVTISNPSVSGSSVSPALSDDTGSGTIINDDGFYVNISADRSRILEDEGPATFTVNLTNPVEWDANVSYILGAAGDDATEGAGNDYQDAGGSPLIFSAGETSKTITVNLINDEIHEGNETFTVTLTGIIPDTNCTIGTSLANITIINDDHYIVMTADNASRIETAYGSAYSASDNSTTFIAAHDSTPSLSMSITDSCYHIADFTVDSVSKGKLSDYADPNDYTSDTYSFDPVKTDHTIGVTTAINTYSVNATVLEEAHGTVSSSDTFDCTHSGGPTYIAQADSGYHITWFKVDNVERSDAKGEESYSYTFSNISDDHNIEVAFTQMIYIENDSPFGTVTPAGNTIDDTLPHIEVDYDDNQTFTVQALSSCPDGLTHNGKQHHISRILWDGNIIDEAGGNASYIYTTKNITEEHTLSIYFTSFVDVTVHGNGSVTGEERAAGGNETTGTFSTNSTDSFEIDANSSIILTAVPDEGYHVSKVNADNATVGQPEIYTFSNMVDQDHSFEVWFTIDTFIIKPVSKFGTIYETASQTTKASARTVDWGSNSTFYIDLDDPDHAVLGVLVDNVSYPIPGAGNSTSYSDFTFLNSGDDYLEVKFKNVKVNHRLEALDYDRTPISDVPLDTKLRPKPASLMFVLDDSGSMDWEFITSENDGRFSGRYYLYSYPSSVRAYGDYSLESAGRQDEWRSQISHYNKMFYNPEVTYTPWPFFEGSQPSCQLPQPAADGQAHANIYRPRFHPWHSQDCTNALNKADGTDPDADVSNASCSQNETFYMDDTFLGFDGLLDTSNAIVVDNSDAGFSTTGNWKSSSSSNAYNGSYLYTSSTNKIDKAIWTLTVPADGKYQLDARWISYYKRDASVKYIISTGSDTYNRWVNQRKNGGKWNKLLTLDLNAGDTVTVTLRDNQNKKSSASADAIRLTPVSGAVDIINAHYFTYNDANGNGELDYTDSDGDGLLDRSEPVTEDIWLVNLTDPIEYYRVIDSSQDITATNLQKVDAASVPSSVKTFASPTDPDAWLKERQNWADWFSYYRKRTYAATAAVARVIDKMENVMIGFRTINYWGGGYKNGGYGFSQPVLPVNVSGQEDKTNELLELLYGFRVQAYGTPLRRGLLRVGQYYDDTDGFDPSGLGESPFHAQEDGDECKQVFAIAMTDGYWNGSSPGVGNVDGIYDAPYKDSYSNTLADVAMKYFDTDLSTLDDMVPDGVNNHQHMVTYTVAFGVHGTLNPDDYDLNSAVYPTWPDPTSSSPAHIDDLWHAAVNGRGKYMNASRPDKLVASLLEIMKDIGSRIGSGASVSVNGDELYESLNGQVRMFQTTYNSGDWHGDLQAYQINTENGEVMVNTPVWSAKEKLSALLGSDGSGHTNRIIAFYDYTDDIGKPFRPGNVSGIQSKNLIPYFSGSLTRQDVVNYLRGDKTNEGQFRRRGSSNSLGDFIHSMARFYDGILYVGGNDGMLHAFYADDTNGGKELFAYVPGLVFHNLRKLADPAYEHKFYVDNTPTVQAMGDVAYLVGGLGKGGKGYYCLDVTNATSIDTETELAARIKWEYPPPPSSLISGNTFTFSSGTGSGGRDLINDSSNQFTAANGFKAGNFITIVGANDSSQGCTNDGTYEIKAVTAGSIELPKNSLVDGCGDGASVTFTSSTSDPDMGYSFSRAFIVKSNDSSINAGTDLEGYVVIFGNGYASENGSAVLYVLNPADGSLLNKIDTDSAPLNGLSTPKVVDVNFDMKADYVYAGDLLGNMWKFDLTSTDHSDWQVAFCDYGSSTDHCKSTVPGMIPRPLFSGLSSGGGATQAITSAPDVMLHASGHGYMVIFGTGRYLGTPDLYSKDTQSLYGIWDWAPDYFDAGYLGARVDDNSTSPPRIELSNWPETDISGNATHTLLRQVAWVEGAISEDSNGNGVLDADEDANHNGVLDPGEDLNGNGLLDPDEDINGNGKIDTYNYYRIPSNYQGDWSMVATNKLDSSHHLYNVDINGDGNVSSADLVPQANLGWCFDLPGKIDLDGDGADNDGDGYVDEDDDSDGTIDERRLGERVVNDTIIRDGKAIIISFGISGTRCNAGGYSFVNERDPNNGGMTYNPVFDLNGDGEIDEEDMVYIYAPNGGGGGGCTTTPIYGIPTDKSYEGRLFNPSILRNEPVEMKYFSTSAGGIATMTETSERRGIYFWREVK